MKSGMIWKAIRFFTYWTSLGALCVLAISAIFKPETLPNIPACSFKQATGRPCPGCGLTRGFCAISHGRFADALHFNPFSFLLYAGTLAVALWPLLSRGSPRLKEWVGRSTLFVWLVPLVLAAMVVFGVFRMIYGPNV